MPVSPTPPDELYFEIARAYQQAELEILGQIRARLEKGDSLDDLDWQKARLAEVQSMRKQMVTQLAKVNSSMTSKINGAFGAAYKGGEWTALKDASEWLPDKPTAVSSATRVASVRAASNAMLGQTAQMMPNLLRTTEDLYAKVVNDTVLRVQAGSGSRREATGRALQQAFGSGLKTGPGGRMNLPDYITMAMRTGVANTSIQGHMDTLGANGMDLVYIHPGPRHCETCDEWSNSPLWRTTGPIGQQYVPSATEDKPYRVMVWGTLDQAKAAGWGHPNCRCNVGAFIPGATVLPQPRPPWDEDGYKAQQEQRAIERKIREWKVKQTLATDPKDAAKAGAKVQEWQNAQLAHMKGHPELKRQYARESVNGFYGPGKGYDGPVSTPKPPKPPKPKPVPPEGPPVTPTKASQVSAKPTPEAPEAPSATSKHREPISAPPQSWKGREKPKSPSEPEMPKTREQEMLAKWEADTKAKFTAYAKATGNPKSDLTQSNNWSYVKKVTDQHDVGALDYLYQNKYVDDKLRQDALDAFAAKGKLTPEQTRAYKTAMAKYGDDLAQYKLNLNQWMTDNGITSAAKGFGEAKRHTNQEGISWAFGQSVGQLQKTTAGGRAASKYSGSAYGPWNADLRNHAPHGAPLKTGNYQKNTADLDKAMVPIKEDVVLHRGTTWEEFNNGQRLPPPPPTDMVGKTYVNHAFASTSVGEWAAFRSKPVQIEIMAPAGTKGVNLMEVSNFGTGEREFLLARGTRFFVHSVRQDGGQWRVKVEIVPDGEDSSVWTPIP